MNFRMIKDISDFIFIKDTLEKADAILIPGGSYPELPEMAAKLWCEGMADYVIPSGKFSIKFGKFLGVKSKADIYNKDYYTECEFYTDVLKSNGVASEYIIEENESQCTADNARFTRKLLDEKGMELKKAIICCKAFHARRCLMFYQFCFPDTKFMIAPVYGSDGMDITKDNWYTTDFGLTRVLGELARLGTQFVPKFQQLKDTLKGEQINRTLRKYAPDDLSEITELFCNTVHGVKGADYSEEQLDVWATGKVDMEANMNKEMDNSSFPQRLDRTIIYESDWVSLYSDKVQMPNGYICNTYHKIHYPHESVSVVIVNEKDEIMMIQSKRYITKRLEWEVPAGRIEADETPETAAKRECMEETGCTLKDLTYLGCHNPSNGMSDLKMHMFAAKVDTESMEIDENEVNAKKWIHKDEVLRMLKDNETQCGVSMLALMYAIQFYI